MRQTAIQAPGTIQLQTHPEAYWDLAINNVPLKGEPIVYSPDDAHPYSRFKLGDGYTIAKYLPFVDAGTIGGIDINNVVAKKVAHKLTFGAGEAFVFDGSADVTVPVYQGN